MTKLNKEEEIRKILIEFVGYLHEDNPYGKTTLVDYDKFVEKISNKMQEERKRILNALRYVVAEDEDGHDTLEEIIKIAGIDK